MIESILDTDLYKFTTSYAYMKLFPNAIGTFVFNDRDNTEYTEEFIQNLNNEICNLGKLQLTDDEFNWVKSNIRFIPTCYWEWLSSFKFNPKKVQVYLDPERHLQINVTDKLYKVTLYETPLLAIVSELRNKMLNYTADDEFVLNKLKNKINYSNTFTLPFAEFGMRRRFSYHVQDIVCKTLKKSALYCTGTSNVHFAMKYNMKAIGTHPHEWFMFHGAQFGYKHANYLGLENWVNVYDGDLGIALSDTYTSDVFLRNLSMKHAKLFDGVRHDSGDPYKFVDKVVNRYKELGIDPMTKTIVFSNALDMATYKSIAAYCLGKIKYSAGIGTNLTNDTGNKPSNIVMKLAKCQMSENQPIYNCIKISDDLGKHMGSQEEFNIAKHELSL